MKKKSRNQHPFIRGFNHLWHAVIVYFFIGLFRLLPVRASSALGGFIGRHVGPYLGATRRARKHLDFIFPEKSAEEKKRIIRDMYDNMGRVCGEAPHITRLIHNVKIEGYEHLVAAKASGRPILFVSGHTGNWELGPIIINDLGIPMAGVYRPPNNPYVDRLIRFLRRDVAAALFTKGPEGTRGMMRWLRGGRSVGLLIDQKLREGVAMDFLGKPAMTGTIPAQLAIMTNAILIAGYVIRERGCKFRGVFLPPVTPPAEGSVADKAEIMTTEINNILSNHIRRYPGQWLWLHRRWIGV